jgi:hypothetical protein
MSTGIGIVGYRYDSAFSSFAKVQWIADEQTIHAQENSSFAIHITPALSAKYMQYIDSHPEMDIKIVVGVFDKYNWIKDLPVPLSLQDCVDHQKTLEFKPQLAKGDYYLIFSIYHVGTITPTHNSKKIKLVIQ